MPNFQIYCQFDEFCSAENGSWFAAPESGQRTVTPNDRARQKVWLFDIDADPNETRDLSYARSDVAIALLRRLGSYLRGSAPVYFPPPDSRANPALHNDSWSDWIIDDVE